MDIASGARVPTVSWVGIRFVGRSVVFLHLPLAYESVNECHFDRPRFLSESASSWIRVVFLGHVERVQIS